MALQPGQAFCETRLRRVEGGAPLAAPAVPLAAPPPARGAFQPTPAASVPAAGVIVWPGRLEKDGALNIAGGSASSWTAQWVEARGAAQPEQPEHRGDHPLADVGRTLLKRACPAQTIQPALEEAP